MKKITIIILFISNMVGAQTISSDSLYAMFQCKNTFEVLDSIYHKSARFNYRQIYLDTRLKPYLMKWLDRAAYFDNNVNERRMFYLKDSGSMKNAIREKLKQLEKTKIDSILNDKKLYNCYADSIANDFMKEDIARCKKDHVYTDPDSYAIKLHSYLAYPESYDSIRKLWEEKGGGGRKNEYFLALVRLGDPEARAIYDGEIQRIVTSNIADDLIITIGRELFGTEFSSYSLLKIRELLDVSDKYEAEYYGKSAEPVYCEFARRLLRDYEFRQIYKNKELETYVDCEVILKYIPEIKAALKKLAEKYEEEELYWKMNMPYYKK